MMNVANKPAISVENLSKIYRLGEIGTGTISQDIERWFRINILKQEDPFLKVGQENDRTRKGDSDIVYSLRNINFEVKQGETVGIIGRNGAGKSTLLKILSRVTSPTTGTINIRGRVASLLEVGTGFHPELTGRENIYLNGTILGMRRREIAKKMDEIISFSGVERYIDTPVKRYSSGMYVRLAFAVAAHLESEILIVDEVLAVGDTEFQNKCLGKMKDVAGLGRTVLFVSHNLAAVKKLCSKGIVLGNGEVVYTGSANDAISSYQGLYNGLVSTKKYWSVEVAPGDFRARLLLVSIQPTQGDQFNITSGLQVNFQVLSNITNCLLDVTFEIYNQEDVLILHHGKAVASNKNIELGIYNVVASIPPFTLNKGEYRMHVWLGINGVEVIGKKLLNVVAFSLENNVVDHITKPLPGVLRTQINYEVDFIR